MIFNYYIVALCLLKVSVTSLESHPNKVAIPVFRLDYQFESEQASYYKVHQGRTNWTHARSICQGEGAQLAVLETSAEAQLMGRLQKKIPDHKVGVYVGVHDRFLEGSFVTVDGRALSEVWSEWAATKPDDAGGDADCVVILPEGKLNDVECCTSLPFICKKSLANIKVNPACNTDDLEYSFDKNNNKCYKLHIQPKKWIDALTICHNEGSYLAIINTDYEAKIFVDLIAKYPQTILNEDFLRHLILVGFHDQFKHGLHLDIKGKPLSESGYMEWVVFHPKYGAPKRFSELKYYQSRGVKQQHRQPRDEHCGSMLRDGKLNDVSCEDRALFICERDM